MSPAAVVPRGQVPIPPDVLEFVRNLYNMKGGITGFSKRSGIKSDTLRVAMKRGTTTQGTLKRMTAAVGKAGALVPVAKARTEASQANGNGNGHGDPAVQVDRLPPAVLRQIERVSGALLDGMQLMQLTMLKALQEELGDGHMLPQRMPKLR